LRNRTTAPEYFAVIKDRNGASSSLNRSRRLV
jgi:hypothetical protein